MFCAQQELPGAAVIVLGRDKKKKKKKNKMSGVS